MVIWLVATYVGFAFGNESFEIKGECSSTSAGPRGEFHQTVDYTFLVKVDRGAWHMRLDDLNVIKGTRRSFDWAEITQT